MANEAEAVVQCLIHVEFLDIRIMDEGALLSHFLADDIFLSDKFFFGVGAGFEGDSASMQKANIEMLKKLLTDPIFQMVQTALAMGAGKIQL